MSVLDAMIGWLAPPVCIVCGQEGSSLCLACAEEEVLPFGIKCWRCGAVSKNGRTCDTCRATGSPLHVWVSTDYEGAAAQLVRLYKYGHQRVAAKTLAATMAQTFLNFNTAEEMTRKNFLIVPVPTASSRVRQRGFDHTSLLAKEIARQLGLPSKNTLMRRGQQHQVGAKRSDRLIQMQGQIYAPRPTQIKGRHIVLVDDVVTTGGTMIAAAKAARAAGAKSVSALIFAKKL
jgi:ComF family protein